jgi:hypothetical protein
MKKTTATILLALLFAGPAMGIQRYWNGKAKPDLDFSNPGNWNTLPVAGDDVALRGQTGGLTDARAVMTDTWSLQHIRIGGNGSASLQGDPTLTLSTGSDLTWSGTAQIGYSLASDTSDANGLFNIESGAHDGVSFNVGNAAGTSPWAASGSMSIANASLHVTGLSRIATGGASATGNSAGTLTISSGGTLTMEAGGSHSLYVGDTGQGNLIIDGGLLSMEDGTIMRLGHNGGDGVVELRSGILDLGKEPQIGTGTGVIEIQEGLLKNTDGVWRNGAYATLANNGSIVATGGLLDDSAYSSLYTQGTGSATNGLYVLKWGTTGSSGSYELGMWATVIPEPATLSIVILSGAGLVFFKRMMNV